MGSGVSPIQSAGVSAGVLPDAAHGGASVPNIALEPTPYSLRFAPAFGRGSPPAFGVLVCAFNLTGAKALGLMIAPEVLYQAHRLIC